MYIKKFVFTFAQLNVNTMGKLELIMETEKVSMYSPKYDGEKQNEFEKFLSEYRFQTNPQLKIFFDAILSALEKMGETGAYERYFRLEGGNIKAIPLYITIPRVNRNTGKMRLYCLRLSDRMLILGRGTVTTVQKNAEDPVILAIIGNLRDIERQIKTITRKGNTNFDVFYSLRQIIETINV